MSDVRTRYLLFTAIVLAAGAGPLAVRAADVTGPAIAGEPLLATRALADLYAGAPHRYWTDPARRRELLEVIRASADDGLTPTDYHLKALERAFATTATDGELSPIDIDRLASDAYAALLHHLYHGKVDPVSIAAHWNIPVRHVREQAVVAAIREALVSGRIRAGAEAARPQHWIYREGLDALARYRAIAAAGGWPLIPTGPTLRVGAQDTRAAVLRRRLAASGDYAAGDLDSPRFDEPLAEALRVFQRRHLLAADGALGRGTLHELNVPVAARIDQLRVNLERGRWALHAIGDGRLVVVDIAGFDVRLISDHEVVWRGRAIVGQPYRQTPVFQAKIDSVVFNPTWTVPPTILAKDVLPGMRRGENVLARKKLEVYRRDGSLVDPATIDWKHATAATFPYVLRQDAGDGNALGRVKINFPNPYLVYLHDTPTRALFEQTDRTFSSGCIRVERPLELAEQLLDDSGSWNGAAIQAAVDSGTTRTVRLRTPVPILVMYWTAETERDGVVVFKRDVYRRDPPLLRALDSRPAGDQAAAQR